LCPLGKQETTWAAANLLRLGIEHYGVPQALYTDWKNVYVRPASEADKQTGKAPLTQFGRMCAKAGQRHHCCHFATSHGTHQDRLIKKLRRKNISPYEAANQFLAETYLPEHNRRYSRAAASEEQAVVPLSLITKP
jgi:hypothetical protein